MEFRSGAQSDGGVQQAIDAEEGAVPVEGSLGECRYLVAGRLEGRFVLVVAFSVMVVL